MWVLGRYAGLPAVMRAAGHVAGEENSAGAEGGGGAGRGRGGCVVTRVTLLLLHPVADGSSGPHTGHLSCSHHPDLDTVNVIPFSIMSNGEKVKRWF